MKRWLAILGVIIAVVFGWKYAVPEQAKTHLAEKNKGMWKRVGGFLKKNAPQFLEFVKEVLL